MVLLITPFLATQPLGLAGATGPLGDMLQGLCRAVPRIIGAALIFFLGYVLAKVAKKAVITASHVERFSTHVGATDPTDPTMLPRTIGGIVFALIIIPVSIAALDTLTIVAISQSATAMLRIILSAAKRTPSSARPVPRSCRPRPSAPAHLSRSRSSA